MHLIKLINKSIIPIKEQKSQIKNFFLKCFKIILELIWTIKKNMKLLWNKLKSMNKKILIRKNQEKCISLTHLKMQYHHRKTIKTKNSLIKC
jgi:hypothetical protein